MVGEEKKEFFIHKELIAAQSPVLKALVNGRMREAHEGRIEWPDVSVDTFVRFAEFAYSRDYKEAEYEVWDGHHESAKQQQAHLRDDGTSRAAEQQSTVVDLTQENTEDLYSTVRASLAALLSTNTQKNEASRSIDDEKVEKMPMDKFAKLPFSLKSYADYEEKYDDMIIQKCVEANLHQRLAEDCMRERTDRCKGKPLQGRNYDPSYYSQRRADIKKYHLHSKLFFESTTIHNFVGGRLKSRCGDSKWEPRPNRSIHENYEPVFRSHVELYIFADRYLIEPLRRLTLSRLSQTLFAFTVYQDGLADLIGPTDLLYCNTVPNDQARHMLAKFWACFAKTPQWHEEFVHLLHKHRDFKADMTKYLSVGLMRSRPRLNTRLIE